LDFGLIDDLNNSTRTINPRIIEKTAKMIPLGSDLREKYNAIKPKIIVTN